MTVKSNQDGAPTKLVSRGKPHVPVLLGETLHYLSPKAGESYLDLTAGYGGHAAAILEETKNDKDGVLVDRDAQAQEYLRGMFNKRPVNIIHADFLSASQQLVSEGRLFDIILADLGVSSLHLDNAVRGFALSKSGPLDMRMDQRQELTAKKIVNRSSEEELTHILKDFGEEPKARAVARAIMANRPVSTTEELANAVAKVWRGRSRRHPATRTFQALRIAVNDELGQLGLAINLWLKLLKPGGRLGVISFHSLEDRIVKRAFREMAGERYDSEFRDLTPRAVTATANEIVSNPRSRSAKLRVVAKIKTKEGQG